MVSSSVQEVFYTGNASTVTAYTVPFVWLSETHVKVARLDAGTGTVTVAAGVATFSSAQPTLGIGSHVRISGTTYTIHEKTSTTVFTFTEEATIAASAFHLPDDAVELVEGSTFTLTGTSGSSSITTDPAIAATALLRVYREVPITQLLNLSETGPLSPANIEDGLDLLTQICQQLYTAIANSGIIVPSGTAVTFRGTTYFADASARALAVPESLYQLGLQVDTKTLYYGSSLAAGGWTRITYVSRVLTDPASDAPLYIGEIATYKGASNPKDKYGPAAYKGTGTAAANWDLMRQNREYGCFQAMVWDDDVPLDRGMKRMAGHSGLYRWVDRIITTVARPGMGSLVVKYKTSDSLGGRIVLTGDTMTITSEDTGSSASPLASLVDPGFGAAGSTQVIAPTDRIYAEIVSAGEDIEVTAVAGSTALTNVNLETVCTGTWLDHDEGGGIATTIVSATSLYRSHPAASDNSTYRRNGRIFARMLAGPFTGGTRTIAGLTSVDTALFCAGDRVIGISVHPDCRIETVPAAGTSITLTHPLPGDAAEITVISEDRPPVVQFALITEASGQTILDAHDTTFILLGDSLWGTNIPAMARVTAKSATTVTSSAALTGDITGYTVRVPRRLATITAGTSTISLTSTDLLIGAKVTGHCIPPDTYIIGVGVGSITVNNLIPATATGGATEVIEINRHELQVTGSVIAASTTLQMGYVVATTYVETDFEPWYIEGDGIQPGTFVTSVSPPFSLILSKAAGATVGAFGSGGTYRLYRPSRWKGLSMSLAGSHYAGTT